jgi:hypothetical protein
MENSDYIDKIRQEIAMDITDENTEEYTEIYKYAIYQCNELEKTMSLEQQLLFLELEKSVEKLNDIKLKCAYKKGFEDGKGTR